MKPIPTFSGPGCQLSQTLMLYKCASKAKDIPIFEAQKRPGFLPTFWGAMFLHDQLQDLLLFGPFLYGLLLGSDGHPPRTFDPSAPAPAPAINARARMRRWPGAGGCHRCKRSWRREPNRLGRTCNYLLGYCLLRHLETIEVVTRRGV